jgi:hypothetical protein
MTYNEFDEIVDELVQLGLEESDAIKLLKLINKVPFESTTGTRAAKFPTESLGTVELLAVIKSRL